MQNPLVISTVSFVLSPARSLALFASARSRALIASASTHAPIASARSFALFATASSLALIASCAMPVGVHSEQLEFEDATVFHFSEIGPRHSMAILNQGPGPIEVLLGEENAHTHPIEIAEGTFEYIRPGDFSSLEIRHPGSGAGKIEWTILEDLRERVRVEFH